MEHVFVKAAKENPGRAREIKLSMIQYTLKYRNQSIIDSKDVRNIAIMINCPQLLDQLTKNDDLFRSQESKIFNHLLETGNRASEEESEPISA